MRPTAVRFAVCLILSVTLTLTFGLRAPAYASPGYTHPGGPKTPSVPLTAVPARKAATVGASMFDGTLDDAAWPTGSAEFAAPADRSLAKAGALPVRAGMAAPSAGAKLRVEFYDRDTAERAGITGVVLRVGRADAAGRTAADRVPVRVDYRSFRNVFGADWGSRLRMVALPACALATPRASRCAGTPLQTSNDVAHGVATATTTLTAGTSLVALEAGAAGPAGDFGSTPLAPSSTWNAGGSTGDFTWSYPLRLPPPPGGTAPVVEFSYSSQAVDGRTSATNNQPSMLGEGFEYSPGFVERRFASCADDMGGDANNTKKTGDFCQATEILHMSLGGQSTELIYSSADGWFHGKKDDGTKIERVKDTSLGNGDNDGEYFVATTANGTKYYFGRNRLPGWSSGKPETKSVYTVPVAGNNPNETCHATAFVDSFCDQAWRWNLDYVVDTNQNTVSYWYSPETNFYGRNMDATKHTKYVRGGMLSRIDYGTRADANFATAPDQVIFEPADRCSTTDNCDPSVQANWKNWLDTPFDQQCKESTDCKDKFSPTFWSTKRLAKVTTQVWNGASYRPVDSWSLRASWTEPRDGQHAGLWLAGITHTGLVGDQISLPETVLTGTAMDNRVDKTGDDIYAYSWLRLTSIRSETGGLTSIFYTDPECVAGTNMPAAPDSNTMRCFPVKWQPEGFGSVITDWFHKYVVRAVTETDLTGGSPPVKKQFVYLGSPAWHHDADDGLVKKNRLTWGEWRGYAGVRALTGEAGEQERSETSYFRGMDGDLLADGTTRHVTVGSEDDDAPVTDADAFAGMTREERTYDKDQVISATVSTPWQSAVTASRRVDDHTTVDARIVQIGSVRGRTRIDHGSGWRHTFKSMTYDGYGLLTQTDDAGDEDVTGTDTVPGDESCIKNTYVRNTTAPNWILDRISKTETYDRPCSVAPKTASDVRAIERTYYDNATVFGTAPTYGNPTRVESLSSWTNASTMSFVAQQRAHYDAYGRVDQAWNISNVKRTTAYETAGAGGPVTKVTNTTIADNVFYTTSAEVDPAWGATTAQVDMNNNRTDVTYDALGRRHEVWNPGRDRKAGANAVFTYVMRTDGVVATQTQTLNAAGKYVTSYTLYDSLLRQREVQTTSPTAGYRIVTERRYDSAGRQVLELGPMTNQATPGPDLVTADPTLVYTQTRKVYDQAGRVTALIYQPRGTEKWRTTTAYNGDHVETVPPAGGTATSVVTDAQGHRTVLKQYAPGADPDSGTVMRYEYDRRGAISKIYDEAGRTWEYRNDLRGRQTYTKDPDHGEVTYTYDAYDRVSTQADSRGSAYALKYTYDTLNRRTGVYDRATNAKRATWTYDTAPGGIGEVATSSRWVGTDEYRQAIRGYNAQGLSTGTTTTLPTSEGALAGSYTFIIGYNDATDGSLAGYTFGGRADLQAETVFYNYDENSGLPVGLDSDYPGGNALVKTASYTGLGQLSGLVLSTDKRGSQEVYRDWFYELGTGRLDHTTLSTTIKGVVSDPHYGYDDAGQITSIADPRSGTADNQCFEEDYLQRLTEAWTPADGDCDPAKRSGATLGGPAPYWQSWSYDDFGGRDTQVDHAMAGGDLSTSYHVNAANHQLASSTGAIAASYSYDKAGNTINRPGATATQTLSWDNEGHLGSVTEGAASLSYLYDADGARMLRKEAGVTTLYLGDDVEIKLTKATGALAETRTYRWNGQVIGQRSAAGVTWICGDQQGTATFAVAAADHRVVSRLQKPFGEGRGSTITWVNDRGFVGGVDDATGLVHLGAREYDPGSGRFVSVDPVVDNGDPQQMNGYAYANNSPISSADPTGLRSDPASSVYDSAFASGGRQNPVPEPADDDKGDPWYKIFYEAHETAIAARVKQIQTKWAKAVHAREGKKAMVYVTISRKDNSIAGASKNGNTGYADIICWNCDPGRIYIWEMKHAGGPAEAEAPAQLNRYITGLQKRVTKETPKGEAPKRVVHGPMFGKEWDITVPNRSKPDELIDVFDGSQPGVQLYRIRDDKEKEPAPTPTPTATLQPPRAPATREPTRPPYTPGPTTRAPEIPHGDGIRVEAPEPSKVAVVVAVVVVAVVVVAAIVLGPAALLGLLFA